jgi:ATP-dependent RNA helicase SUPV3L1/SUV3
VLSGAQHLAGSGRTSFPVDKLLDRDAYRTLGYRQCGERAVRVDILERLADLIRPALAWRESSPGTKPAGAFDGRGFVVTQAMTSLAGSAGEDFASILRALGYRMERRPAPPPAPTPVVADAVSAEATTSTGAEQDHAGVDAETVAPTVAGENHAVADGATSTQAVADEHVTSSASLLPDVAFATASEAETPPVEAQQELAQAETQPVEAPSAETQSAETPSAETQSAEIQSAAVDAVDAPVTADAVVTDPEAAPEVVAAPEMIDVWRPGGRSEERRPRHDRNRHRHHDRAKEAAPAATAAVAVEGGASEDAKRERPGRGRRERRDFKEFQRPRTDAPKEGAQAPADAAPNRDNRDNKGRPPRERFQGKGREKGKFQGGREGRSDSGAALRPFASSAPRERDRPMDPNSPFAKLAALKEQLTANRKD